MRLHATFVSKPGPCWDIWCSTWLFLSRLGQVGDTCVRAHEDVAGMQGALQEALFGLRYMDSSQGSLRKCVGRHQGQAVHPDLMNAVYGLKHKGNARKNRVSQWISVKLSGNSEDVALILQHEKNYNMMQHLDS